MSGELAPKLSAPPARRLGRGNTMAFPRELRNAIPDLPTYVGRVLQLVATRGHASNLNLFGPRVHLNLHLSETGKLKGKFTVRMDLEVAAARALAASLMQLADRAEKLPASGLAQVKMSYRKRR